MEDCLNENQDCFINCLDGSNKIHKKLHRFEKWAKITE